MNFSLNNVLPSLELADLNVAPPTIDVVVTTHGHPNHASNIGEFPDARHYAGFFMHHQAMFNLSELFEVGTLLNSSDANNANFAERHSEIKRKRTSAPGTSAYFG